MRAEQPSASMHAIKPVHPCHWKKTVPNGYQFNGESSRDSIGSSAQLKTIEYLEDVRQSLVVRDLQLRSIYELYLKVDSPK